MEGRKEDVKGRLRVIKGRFKPAGAEQVVDVDAIAKQHDDSSSDLWLDAINAPEVREPLNEPGGKKGKVTFEEHSKAKSLAKRLDGDKPPTE